jgi:hypothetical protein
MQQYREGQRLQGSDGNIYVVQGGVPRLAQPSGPQVVMPAPQKPAEPKFVPGAPGYVYDPKTGGANPIPGLPPTKTTYRVLNAEEKRERGLDPSGDYQISSEGQITALTPPKNNDNKLTAKERADAIQGHVDAAALERIADDLEAKFQAGPGATKGLGGLQDYLPTAGNRRFNDTGYQARGLVKRALGFTGGEGNTIGEIQLNYGPYLPEAGDYDEQIVNKIGALRRLAQDSRTRSVAVLGGVPDANGRVTPVEQGRQQQEEQSPPGYIGGDGRLTTEAGQHRDPRFAGIEGQYRQMLAKGEAPGKILQFLRAQGIDANPQDVVEQARWLKQNPGKINQLDTSQIEMVWRDKITRNTLGIDPESGLGAYGVASANALTGGTLDELAGVFGGDQQQAQIAKDALRQRNPGASLAGDISGAALGMTGINAGLRAAGGRMAGLATRGGGIGGDMLYGAGYGAGEGNDDRLTGALQGAGSAGAGNLVGRGVISGAGRAARGVADPNLQYLHGRGISLTPGQIAGQGGVMGRGLRAIEDTLESVPFLGSAIRSRKEEGLQGFNREAFRDALAPINQQLGGDIGQEAIGQAQDMVGDAYGSALDGVELRADRPFLSATDDIIQRGTAVPVMGEQFNYLVSQKVDPLFGPNIKLDGKGFQSALQTLNKAGADFPKQGIMGGEVAGNVRELKDAFIEMANRQAPQAMPALNAANSANRNVSILGDAVTHAVNNSVESGMFTPAQLGRKAVENTKKFGGKKNAARGNVPFRDLTEAGQSVMPNVVPNSGTTDRALATFVLPAALGGSAAGSEALGLPAPVTGALGTLALLSTRKGNNAVQSLALSRNDVVRRIGEELLRQRRAAGMFGAGAAMPLLGN